MSELPERPNLDQLRRQARELLRAATAGEPGAVDRLAGVSERRTLSAAQLSIAREHGFSSWPALHAEVERRRVSAPVTTAAVGLTAGKLSALVPEWRSLGGPATVDASAGTLSISVVLLSPGRGFADGWLMPSPLTERQLAGPSSPRIPATRFLGGLLGRGRSQVPGPGFGDVVVSDDRGALYALGAEEMVVPRAVPGRVRGPIWLRLGLDPAPPASCGWIEIRGPGGQAARLLQSARPQVRVTGPVPAAGTRAGRELAGLAISLINVWLDVGADPGMAADTQEVLGRECSAALARLAQLRDEGELDATGDLPGDLARLIEVLTDHRPAADLPPGWAGILGAAQAGDGPSRHLDLGAYVPGPEGIGVQLDTLTSEPSRWQVYLRAVPGWWPGGGDSPRRRESLSVTGEDNLGGMYASNFGGGAGHGNHDELAMAFRPRLNPHARTLALTFTGPHEQTTALIPVAGTGSPERR